MIEDYHFHIYFDSDSKEFALKLRDRILLKDGINYQNKIHSFPIGPHVLPQYAIVCPVELFPILIRFFMLNNGGLSILIHPNTGNAIKDHLDHAVWIGKQLPLLTDAL